MPLIYQSQDKTANLRHEHESKALVLQFIGDVPHETYVEASEVLLSYLREYDYYKYIFDNRKLTFVSVQSRAWFIRQFFAKLHRPKQRIAVVSSEISASSRVAVDTIKETMISMGFEFSSFITTSMEEALVWIAQE